ncbi:hypothetical protein HNR06_002927 [Nocardiopsis arvandica]|uniref:Restriction endonuclease domain-containing protein n=1 Tax=Nocardiopsis sinuspersici TaxID=501010 RepID=A0A7Y9XEY9_9ACTN|nr:hypothetical protein [Nocardiopsis sinuspersici]NYH53338.1 hypothetical protein [Nocardiopsis sinuspersici]
MTTRHPEAPERRLTVDDLERTPDDGRRYELVDGRFDVSPAPKPVHTRASHRLGFRLGTDLPFPLRLMPHWLTASGPWRRHIGGEPESEGAQATQR